MEFAPKTIAARRRGPLDGVIVLDLTRAVAGPQATIVLPTWGLE